jgi:acyl-CoA thioesterase-1
MDHIALQPSLMQADDIHPNADGQPLLLDNVWPVLRPMLTR